MCIDHVEYMTSMPNLLELPPRLDAYVTMRAEGRAVDGKGIKAKPLHAKACAVLREAAIIGELPRGRVAELTGLSERRARSLLASLLEEWLLTATSDKHGQARLPAARRGLLVPEPVPDDRIKRNKLNRVLIQ